MYIFVIYFVLQPVAVFVDNPEDTFGVFFNMLVTIFMLKKISIILLISIDFGKNGCIFVA